MIARGPSQTEWPLAIHGKTPKSEGVHVVAVYSPDPNAPERALPLMSSSVRAGFPSPADDFVEKRLDLNQHFVRNPHSTFFVRAEGDSMTEACIHDKAILVVDRSVEATDGRVIVAIVEGKWAVKRLRKKGQQVWLESAARDPAKYPPISVTDPEAMIWGVVVHAINPV